MKYIIRDANNDPVAFITSLYASVDGKEAQFDTQAEAEQERDAIVSNDDDLVLPLSIIPVGCR